VSQAIGNPVTKRVVTGIAWYRRDQWPRLRELASDADKLDQSYEDWLAGAQRTLVQMSVAGVRAQRVDVDLDELVRWCLAEGRPLNSAARAAFAASRLRLAHEGTRYGDV
jgi:hypothetical protein